MDIVYGKCSIIFNVLIKILLAYFLAANGSAAVAEETKDSGLIVHVETLEKTLGWEIAASNLAELVENIPLPVVDGKIVAADYVADLEYDFAIVRNGGWRKLTFSTWNFKDDSRSVIGWRILTEPYMTGDLSEQLTLGRSVWTYNLRDDASNQCSITEGELFHRYYYLKGGNYVAGGANGCTTEGPVWRRKRFLLETDTNGE